MSRNILIKKSKINLLNAQVAQLHDSGLFTPDEISKLTSPLIVQVQLMNDELTKDLQSKKINTPQTIS